MICPFNWILSMSALGCVYMKICSAPSQTKALWSYPSHSLAEQENSLRAILALLLGGFEMSVMCMLLM